MKNAPSSWTYFVRKDAGIGEAVMLYRQHNYQSYTEMSATCLDNLSLLDGPSWIPCPIELGSGFRTITQLQAEVFWPNLTKENQP